MTYSIEILRIFKKRYFERNLCLKLNKTLVNHHRYFSERIMFSFVIKYKYVLVGRLCLWLCIKTKSRVFLQCQLWIVNYYVKNSSNNLSNENIKTGASREMIFQKFWLFGILIHVLSWSQQKHQCLCIHYWD